MICFTRASGTLENNARNLLQYTQISFRGVDEGVHTKTNIALCRYPLDILSIIRMCGIHMSSFSPIQSF